jgi:hypothetical protein
MPTGSGCLRSATHSTWPVRGCSVTRTYLLAFFTQQLGHHHQRLLDRPSDRYPEILFER